MRCQISSLLLLLFFGGLIFIKIDLLNPSTVAFYVSVCGISILTILNCIFSKKEGIVYWRVTFSEIIWMIYLLIIIVHSLVIQRVSFEYILSSAATLLFLVLLKKNNIDLLNFSVGITFIAFIQSLYGIGQYFNFFKSVGVFKVVGTFDNPIGYASSLVISVPFVLNMLQKKSKFRKIIICVLLLIIMAIIFSNSRTAIFALLILLSFYLFFNLKNKIRDKKKFIIIVIIISALLLLSIIFLYSLKIDSSNGRLLIWRITFDMIKDSFVFGHGQGGFLSKYMIYQAGFLKGKAEYDYSLLADNVTHPFNEFLFLMSENGVIAIISVLILLVIFIHTYRQKCKDEYKQIHLLVILSGFSLGLFSYPFRYPFVWYLFLFSYVTILKQEKSFIILKIKHFFFKYSALFVSLIVLLFSVCLYKQEYTWSKLLRVYPLKKYLFSENYPKMYKALHTNGYFLYNYAVIMNREEYYDRSNCLLRECANYLNDADVQLLMADNYIHLKEYRLAENSFLLASEMVPCRFIPLYELLKMYESVGDKENATLIANKLKNKKIKVPSFKIEEILEYVNEYY